MDLSRFPRVSLGHWPTPLEPLTRLSDHLGGPRLWIKRDDCTGLALGGNKTRKLEFLLADALAQGADTVITTGGPQSNHARQTAAAAAKLGLRCELVLPHVSKWNSALYEVNGNVLLDELFGATVHIVETRAMAAAKIDEATRSVAGRGGQAYFIPTGGSTALGALAYAEAAGEYARQADGRSIHADYIVVTTGSSSTHGGLVAGFARLDRRERILGMSIAHPAGEAAETVRKRAEEASQLAGWPTGGIAQRVDVRDDYLGDGYGQPTEGMLEALSIVARLEGILLDPVYTGKTMAGLIDLVRKGFFERSDDVVFWHTGGTPALFAYQDLLAKSCDRVRDD